MWAGPAENCRRVSVRPGEPAWMLAQGALCRDATSRPARSPGGINGGDRGAAIFPPGAGIVKGTAIVPLTRSQVVLSQRSDITKVNVAIRRRQQIHYLRRATHHR